MLSKLFSVFSSSPTIDPNDEVEQISEAMVYSKAIRDLVLIDALYANQVGEWFAKGGEKLLGQEREIALKAPTNLGKRKGFSDAAVSVARYLVEQEKTFDKGDPIPEAIFLLGHVLRMNGLVYDDSPAIVAAAEEALYRCEGLLVACAGLWEQTNN